MIVTNRHPAGIGFSVARLQSEVRRKKIEHFRCSSVIATLQQPCDPPTMLRRLALIVVLAIAARESAAIPKVHVITFGKWMSVKWPDATGQKLLDLKVRPLFVDTRLKEYTTGTPHDLTDRLFVVRRVFRVNDALPAENTVRWQWQRGGWLLVDRASGRITQMTLPEFDPF